MRGRSPDPLDLFVSKLSSDPRAPTSVTDPDAARLVHVADSLSGLEVAELAAARRIADVGSGAGFPGAALATALPKAHVDLVEASSRKCAFLRDALEAAGIPNAAVVCARSEEWAVAQTPAGGREAYDAVTMRAIGSLATDAELASPLLRDGGVAVLWKGSRDPDEEDELARSLPRLAMEVTEVRPVSPYPGSRDRHLHVLRKSGPTPEDLPRRPGMAAKRPLGARRAVG
jgi:16S rRNA (guanine527-N7)-methyltransferase